MCELFVLGADSAQDKYHMIFSFNSFVVLLSHISYLIEMARGAVASTILKPIRQIATCVVPTASCIRLVPVLRFRNFWIDTYDPTGSICLCLWKLRDMLYSM